MSFSLIALLGVFVVRLCYCRCSILLASCLFCFFVCWFLFVPFELFFFSFISLGSGVCVGLSKEGSSQLCVIGFCC